MRQTVRQNERQKNEGEKRNSGRARGDEALFADSGPRMRAAAKG